MGTCPQCGTGDAHGGEFCPRCGVPLPGQGQVRKVVTAVFCDLVGSTAIGDRLDPEAQRALTTRYFEEMRGVVERHGGIVEKFIGDAVMAIFGVPLAHEDDALRGVRAAAEMQQHVADLDREIASAYGIDLAVRIGVNTGVVVAGEPDGGAIVTGDAVNVAARLEQAAAPGQVLLGEMTAQLVQDAVSLRELPPLLVRGKPGPLPVWLLVAVPTGTGRVERRRRGTFVGRRRELRLLGDVLERCRDERLCELVTVLGDAGVGKTRLAEELLDGLDRDVTVLSARCPAYGEGVALSPLRELVEAAAGIGTGAPRAAPVPDRVAMLLTGQPDAEEVARELAPLVGHDGATSAGTDMRWALRRLVETLAHRQLLLLLIDDAQWAEDALLDVLEYLAGALRSVPVLLLCVARSEFLDAHPHWGGGMANATALQLTPLTDDDVGLLLADLVAAEAGPRIRGEVAAAAGGNPLFVEQLVAMLDEQGRLVRDEGCCDIPAAEEGIALPPSILALVTARLDRLSPDERQLLEAASVIGQRFSAGAAADLASVDEPEPVLSRLVRTDLVQTDPEGQAPHDAHRFTHVLVRDAAYDAVPKVRRAALHERYAAWLDDQVDGPGAVDEVVGHHLEQAYRMRRAVAPADDAARALGARAATRLAAAATRLGAVDPGSAVRLYDRAVAVDTDDLRRLRLVARQSALMVRYGNLGSARERLERAREAAVALGDDAVRTLVELRLALVSSHFTVELDAESMGLDLAKRAEERFADDDDVMLAAAAVRILVETLLSRYDDLVATTYAAAERARRVGDGVTEMLLLGQRLGMLVYGTTPIDVALREVEQTRDRMVRGPSAFRNQAEATRACLLALAGEFESARAIVPGLLAYCRDRGGPLDEFITGMLLAEMEWQAGDPAAAACRLQPSLDWLAGEGEKPWLSTQAARLGRFLLAIGDRDGALRRVAQGRDSTADDDVLSQAEWRGVQARLDADAGDDATALELGDSAVAWAERAQSLMVPAVAYTDRAYVHERAGRVDAAVADLRVALSLAQRKGAAPEARRISERLGSLTRPAGRETAGQSMQPS